MGHFRKSRLVTRIGLLTAMSATTPAAAATFDGDWAVQIISSSTACSSGASVSLGISNGRVASNTAAVAASGHVAGAGIISVTLTSGMKRAVGSGHLSGSTGSGTWRAALCAGTWTAQRI